jgi:hypothetical protein
MDKATSSDGTPTGERYLHSNARRGSRAARVRWAAVPLLSYEDPETPPGQGRPERRP